jgi:hypothetical protein
MLIAVFDGLHFLDPNDMFQNVAWSLLYRGIDSIEDPIIGCLSHLKRICQKLDIQLDNVFAWNKLDDNWLTSIQTPCLFIISGNPSSLQISQVIEFVKYGSNLVIIPPPLQMIYNSSNSFDASHALFLNTLSSYIGCNIKENREIQVGKGHVFYVENANQVNDYLMEPGPTGGFKESEKNEKEKSIETLLQKFSTFNVSYIDCQIRSVPICWPQGHSLVIEIEIFQRGVHVIDEAIIKIEMHSSFEPLSITEIQVKNLHPKSKRSLAVLAVPRVKGIYHNPFAIKVKFQDKENLIFLPDRQIEVIDNLPELLRSSRPTNVDLASTLPKYELQLQPLATASSIVDLLNVDPDAVVAKVRRIGEHICKSIARRHLNGYNSKWTFSVITTKLFDASILSPKAKGYIDTIRIFGNMVAHSDDIDVTSFDREDALSVCYALVLFLKEVTEAGLI